MSTIMTRTDRVVDVMLKTILLVVSVTAFFPFMYVFAVSFSSYEDVLRGGILLWPKNWSLDAYTWVLTSPNVIRSLGNSLFITVVGTAVNMFCTVSLAYALARRELPGRRVMLLLVIFTMLFAPGIIPRYIVVKELGLINNLWALILPVAVNAFNLIVMRNFFMSLPEELFESAKIDGANDINILVRIVLPLSGPVLAAIGLFYAVYHWNSFFNAILYLTDQSLWPLQLVLRQVVLAGTALRDVEVLGSSPPPPLTIRMATLMVATLPILCVYPWLQKYFVKGVLTGAIKG